jgi:hypothetical protein
MFELDFDKSQPPILPPHDVWVARYKETLAEEDQAMTDSESSPSTNPRTMTGQFAGNVILIDSATYEEITNG